jgi:hypothetical protein
VMLATPADDYDWNWPADIFAAKARARPPEDDGSQVPRMS